MQMTVLATKVYAAGVHVIPPTSIPDAISNIEIDILRCTSADTTIWPNSTDTISYELDLSLDGGVTYQPWAVGTDSGGIVTEKQGELATMNISGSVTPGTQRFFKGTITLSASIKTGATVTVT